MLRTLRDPVLRDSARRLRRDATDAERKLWQAIRADALGVRFRRQHPVGGVITDFACLEARVIVEIDGGQHGGARDAQRDEALRADGWRVLRYWNNDVLENVGGVVADIAAVVRERAARR
jgi:very-short-patch-repair endonuclease